MISRIRTRRGRRDRAVPAVSLTPLIDTALTLLVVFMVTAPIAHRSIRVDLPRGAASSEQSTQVAELIITIDQHEQLFCGKEQIARAACATHVMQRIEEAGGTVQVYLRVDRRASAGSAVELLSILRALEGVQSVAFDIDDHTVRQR